MPSVVPATASRWRTRTLRYLNPLPGNLGAILGNYRRVRIPELNMGQLRWLIRARYLVDAVGQNQVTGPAVRRRGRLSTRFGSSSMSWSP